MTTVCARAPAENGLFPVILPETNAIYRNVTYLKHSAGKFIANNFY